jgi:ubiquinone/menaquinone biosynthesis C-methylase UbiE
MVRDYVSAGNYKKTRQLKTRKYFWAEYAKPKIVTNNEIAKLMELNGGERVLDVGCGFGDMLLTLRKNGHKGELYGIDSSIGMIKKAKSVSKFADIHFGVVMAEKLPFKSGSFDAMICKHALYHFDLEKAVPEMHRVLKKGGMLVVTINSLAGGSYRHFEVYKKMISDSLGNPNHQDNNSRVNFENYKEKLPGFSVLREARLVRKVRLKNSGPVVEYMESFREMWSPVPGNFAWKEAMSKVREDVENEIESNGSFEEKRIVGIGILIKR